VLDPRPMPWPRRLPRPATPTTLQRFASVRCEAFSFTVLGRGSGRWGFLGRREVILVSDPLLELLGADEQEAVIAHELGHLHALDSRYLTFLRTGARLVRWDPVVGVLARSMTEREELRADRVAVDLTGRPGALAVALRKVSEVEPSSARAFAFGLLGAGGGNRRPLTEERIRRLLELSGAPASEGA
jgi:Zn-dependent protease with chaperone function